MPPDAQAYALSAGDEGLIRLVFGDGFLRELEPRVYTADLGGDVYKAAFIPSRNEIWLNRRARVEPLTLLHEATHYYQKNRLGRVMTPSRCYDLPPSLAERVDVEQEAMIVMDYARIVDPPACGDYNDRSLPPLEDVVTYLRAYMGLDLSSRPHDGG
jgi:hypothetical protein